MRLLRGTDGNTDQTTGLATAPPPLTTARTGWHWSSSSTPGREDESWRSCESCDLRQQKGSHLHRTTLPGDSAKFLSRSASTEARRCGSGEADCGRRMWRRGVWVAIKGSEQQDTFSRKTLRFGSESRTHTTQMHHTYRVHQKPRLRTTTSGPLMPYVRLSTVSREGNVESNEQYPRYNRFIIHLGPKRVIWNLLHLDHPAPT
eukprot:COSAG02_NODE_2989_length_7609_cov_11.207723_3_plen_203_part_00